MKLKYTLLATTFAACCGFASFVQAGTATDTFQVQITILSSCSVTAGAGSNIDIGSVPADTPAGDASLQGTSNISVTCSSGTPYIIGLATSDGDDGTGHMSGTGGNTDKVPYSLFQDSSYSVPWGNTGTAVGDEGNDYVSTGSTAGDGTGSAQTIPVYAEVTDPNFTPDTYSDTVTVNVIY